MALLVLDVLLGVVSRYVMGKQVSWTEELACLLLVWSSFFGIALAFDSRAHLGIDLIVNMMTDTPRKTAATIAHLVTIVFTVVAFLYGGCFLLHKAMFVTRNVMPALQIPDAVMYLPIPVSGLFILYFEICNYAEDVLGKKGKEA
jgi:TRAP-type C4-dicarboxylate transport system permease small subunit